MVIALVVVLAGVGVFFVVANDDGDDLRDQYVEAIVSGWPDDSEEVDEIFRDLSDDDVRCMAEVQVDTVGVDRLAEDYTPDELENEIHADPGFDLDLDGDPTQEQAEQIVAGMDRCLGYFEILRSGAADVPSATPEGADCIAEALDDSFLREAMIDAIVEGSEADLSTTIALRVEDLCGQLDP